MPPLFSAVSSSARQLFILLRCIAFSPKAQVQISAEGLRFCVDDARVMQGLAFLDKSLFTTFKFLPGEALPSEQAASQRGSQPAEEDLPYFEISLAALLETLQILTPNDSFSRQSTREPSYMGNATSAFDTRVLGMPSLCRLTYSEPGAPLRIELEEENVTTTCSLMSYEPEPIYEDIPFDKQRVALKIIMRASWLYDAINELSSTGPERLIMTASPDAPFFTLSAEGSLGSATMEFSKDPQLLETFQVPQKTVNSYKFSMIKAASRAMSVANKVSIRGDEQGVLSLQFMVEVEGGNVNFIDFRFVPFLSEDEDEYSESEDNGVASDGEIDNPNE